jgi:hypothetical protein
MSLTIKKTTEKNILIRGTEFELNEVYGRLQFVSRENGLTLEIAVGIYLNQDAYLQHKFLLTDIPSHLEYLNVNLGEDEKQSLETAHKYAKLAYEQLGYEVIIN